ncbi:hypothetical protein GCM10010191_51990 [Actinomadura vinacea]|uniref:CU044_5270 family protein n=1 Tax=Actinomadura vinacea TaxID=115336 RepID=A0ABN3JIW3_9ACTN
MDELDALRQMRTALAEEEHPDRIALRTNWRAGTRERPRRGFRVQLGGFRIPLVSMVATAAVVTSAVAVVTLRSDPEPAPQNGNVLLVAATNAQKAPIGKYWHVKKRSGEIKAVGKKASTHYRVDSRQGGEIWAERNGKAIQAHREFADVPVTAEDKRRWQAAGSPEKPRIPDPDDANDYVMLDMTPRGSQTPPAWYPSDDRYFGLTAAQIAKLPTEPRALEEALLNLEGVWRAVATSNKPEPLRALHGQDRVRALSDVTVTLLSTAPAPPAVRAAVFRMLAAQPGVKAEGKVTDPIGRTGTAVSLPLETTMPLGLYTAPKQLATYRRQMIIDPDAGTLLAIRHLVDKPPRGRKKLPSGDLGQTRWLKAENMPDRFHRPGELASYEVYEVTEWTNAEPQR